MSMTLADFTIVFVVLYPLPKDLPDERGYTAQTSAQFQATFNELHPQGWRLKWIKGYEKDGVSRFDSDWHKPSKPPRFWSFHNLDREQYDARTAQIKKDGYVEKLKSTWKVDGMERFWTVWELK